VKIYIIYSIGHIKYNIIAGNGTFALIPHIKIEKIPLTIILFLNFFIPILLSFTSWITCKFSPLQLNPGLIMISGCWIISDATWNYIIHNSGVRHPEESGHSPACTQEFINFESPHSVVCLLINHQYPTIVTAWLPLDEP